MPRSFCDRAVAGTDPSALCWGPFGHRPCHASRAGRYCYSRRLVAECVERARQPDTGAVKDPTGCKDCRASMVGRGRRPMDAETRITWAERALDLVALALGVTLLLAAPTGRVLITRPMVVVLAGVVLLATG